MRLGGKKSLEEKVTEAFIAHGVNEVSRCLARWPGVGDWARPVRDENDGVEEKDEKSGDVRKGSE